MMDRIKRMVDVFFEQPNWVVVIAGVGLGLITAEIAFMIAGK